MDLAVGMKPARGFLRGGEEKVMSMFWPRSAVHVGPNCLHFFDFVVSKGFRHTTGQLLPHVFNEK
jgi:hypothetical protein